MSDKPERIKSAAGEVNQAAWDEVFLLINKGMIPPTFTSASAAHAAILAEMEFRQRSKAQ
jgi:hypothetical protein